MGRPNIIKNLIIDALKERDLTFTEIQEKVSKKLNKTIQKNPIAENLKILENEKIITRIPKGDKFYYHLTNNILFKNILEIVEHSFTNQINAIDFCLNTQLPSIFFSSGDKVIIPYSPFTPDFQEIAIRNITQNLLTNFEKLNESEKIGLIKLFGSAYWLGVKKWLEKLKNDFEKIKEEKIDEKRYAFYSKILESINQGNLGDFLLKFFEAFKAFSSPEMLKIEKIQQKKEELPFKHKIIFEELDKDINIIYRMPWSHILETLFNEIKNPYLKNYPHIFNVFINEIFFKNIHLLKEINDKNAEIFLFQNLEYLKKLEDIINNSKFLAICFFGFELEPFERKSLLPFFENWYKALKQGRLDHRLYLFSKETIKKIEKAIDNIRIGSLPYNEKIDYKEPWTLQYLYFEHPDGNKLEFWKNLSDSLKERFNHIFDEWYEKFKRGDLDNEISLKSINDAIKNLEFAIKHIKNKKPPKGIINIANFTIDLKDLYLYHKKGKDLDFWEDLLNILNERAKIIEKQ